MAQQFATIEDYVRSFPQDVQILLEEVRRSIRRAAPVAEETISYQMPTITLGGKNLVHFAAWKHYISLYPLPAVDEALANELETLIRAAPEQWHLLQPNWPSDREGR